MIFKIKKLDNKQMFYAGLAMVILSYIPYLLLGENSIVPYHDQLDGEIIAYIYQAKYLFSKGNTIPEFLNGASKTALTVPAPLALILFKIFSPFLAYMILQFSCHVVSYVGMYFLSLECTDNGIIALIAAMLFTYIPFLPLYGFSQYGASCLILCVLWLYRGVHKCVSYFYIVLYAMMSSLILCGFAWLGAGVLWVGILGLRKQLKKHKEIVAGMCLMLSMYFLENISLIGQILGITESVVSHKSEYVLNSKPFWSTFTGYLKNNDEHSSDNHVWIFYLTCFVMILLWCGIKYVAGQNLDGLIIQRKRITSIFIFISLVCLIAAFSENSIIVAARERMGTLKAFQLSRVLWITSAFWYVELVLCLDVLWNMRSRMKYAMYMVSAPLLMYAFFITLKASMIKPCIQEILLPEYETISYSDYLAIGVMEQVETHIQEKDGLTKEEYKVASIGIDPSAALYHGFYCVDGYSNNYDLEYKHKFREVILPELERNEWLKSYYDDWGNRCYLFFSEIPGYYNVEKNSAWINNLQLDTKSLKNLGCDYILSALYIVNAEELNLEWMDERTFETENSYYQIFIYKIKKFD